MGLEQGQELGKFLYNLAQSAAIRTAETGKAFRKAATRLEKTQKVTFQEGIDKIVGDQAHQDRFLNSSKDWVKDAGSSEKAKQTAALKNLKNPDAQLTAANITDAKKVLDTSMNMVRTREGHAPPWLKNMGDRIQNDPKAAEFVSRLALIPERLREDPYVLERELMRYALSDSSALTPEGRAERMLIMQETTRHIRARLNELGFSESQKKMFSQATMTSLGGEDVGLLELKYARSLEDRRMVTFVQEKYSRPASAGEYRNAGSVDIPTAGSGKLKDALDDIRQLVGSDKIESGHTARVAEDAINRWLTKRNNKTGVLEIGGDGAKVLREFRSRLYEYESKLAELGQQHSSIYLDRIETEALVRNPILFFEMYSRSLEQMIYEYGYESDVFQDKLQRFKLLVDWYTSDSYDKMVGGDGLSLEVLVDRATSQETFDRVYHNRQLYINQKAETLNIYHSRARSLDLVVALNHGDSYADDTRLMQMVESLGDRGVFGGGAHYGELGDLMMQKIREHHIELLNHPSMGIAHRSSAELRHQATQEAVRELHEERALHQEDYAKHLRQQLEEMRDIVGEGSPSVDEMFQEINKITSLDSEETCKSIGVYAEALYMLRFEQQEDTYTFAATPIAGEDVGDITSFAGATWVDREGFADRVRDMFLRKWRNWTDHARTIWQGRCLMYIEKDDKLFDWGMERTNILYDKIHGQNGYGHDWLHMEEWEHANHKGYFADVKRFLELNPNASFDSVPVELKPKIDEYSTFLELKSIFADYHHKMNLAPNGSDAEYARFFATIDKDPPRGMHLFKDDRDNLLHYVLVDIGGDFAQRDAINFYGFWKSGVRRNAVLRAVRLHPRYAPAFEHNFVSPLGLDDNGNPENGIMVGGRLYGAAESYFNPKIERHDAIGDKGFTNELKAAAKTHPHMLYRARHAVETKYYHPEMRLTAAEEKKLNDSVRLFHLINHELQMRGELPIHYGLASNAQEINQWTPMQQDVFRHVFDKLADAAPMKPDEFLASMKGYYTDVSTHIDDFLDVKYAHQFSSVLWTDDIPLTQVEKTNLMSIFAEEADAETAALMMKAKDNIAASRAISDRGRGRTGLWVTGMHDFRLCIKDQITNFMGTMEADPEAAMKSMVTMDSTFFGYNSETDAGVSTCGALSGYLDAAKTRTWRWFKWLNLSSRLRKATNSTHSPSWTVDERHGFVDKIQATRGALSHRAPATFEATESQTGISNWRNILTMRRRSYRAHKENPVAKAIRSAADRLPPDSRRSKLIHRVLPNLFAHKRQTYTHRTRFFENIFNNTIGRVFMQNVPAHERFSRFVEGLNLRAPSGVWSFTGSNIAVYGTIIIVGGTIVSGMGGEEHKE